MGLPLYKDTGDLPRPFPHGHQPDITDSPWARYLAWESSDEESDLTVPKAEGRDKQKEYPGIKPCTRETIGNDRYAASGVIRLRCDASGHETIVHICVVREQSEWLRDWIDQSDSDDEVLVHIPRHIKWWQVAWALEYMYEGRVPGFHLLAGEKWPVVFPRRSPRSIAWGLEELWKAARFFGLGGLEQRAEGAFSEYFVVGIRDSIRLHHENLALGESEGTASGVAWPERRVGFEFAQAAWRLYGSLFMIPKDYFGQHMDQYGYGSNEYTAQDEGAIRRWEMAMFDSIGAPGDVEAGLLTENVSAGLVTQYRDTFRPQMIYLCESFARLGLFELEWFQRSMSRELTCPLWFRMALRQVMRASPTSWPTAENPGAPN